MIVKPQQWAFSPGLIAPEWRWFHRDALSILPLWDASIGTSDPYDIARKLFAQLTIDAINHTTWTETEFGRAVFSTHRNNSPTPGTLADGLDFSSNPISVSAGSDFTFIFHGIIDSIFGNNGGFWRSGSSNFGPNFNIFNASQRRPWVRWNGIDILKITSGQDFNLGTVVSLVFRIKSGASVDFWVDGIEKHSATHTQSTPSFSIYHVGLQASGSEAVYCKYAMLGFWSRAWSDNEIVVWSRNPFGPFRMADDPPIWQVAAAGGGTVIVGLANELDTAFAITRSKQSQLALAQETDIGLGVSAQHRLQLGLASESGIAFAVSPQRKFAVAQALEVDTAFGVSRQKNRSVGLARDRKSVV